MKKYFEVNKIYKVINSPLGCSPLYFKVKSINILIDEMGEWCSFDTDDSVRTNGVLDWTKFFSIDIKYDFSFWSHLFSKANFMNDFIEVVNHNELITAQEDIDSHLEKIKG